MQVDCIGASVCGQTCKTIGCHKCLKFLETVAEYVSECLQAASTTADTVVNALRSVAEVMGGADQFRTSGPSRQRSFSESDAWETGLRKSQVLSIGALSRIP